MKANTIIIEPTNQNKFGLNPFNSEEKKQIKIIESIEEPAKGLFFISLYSQLFSENTIKVFIRENKLIIFVTEIVDCRESASFYVSDWQNYFPQSYTRMRHVNLLLPGDNFFILRHFLVPEKFLLKIFLAKPSEN